MYPEHRLRIIAYLVKIGKQLNDLSEVELPSADHERLIHLVKIRESLTSALNSSAVHDSVPSPPGSALEVER